MMDKKPWEPFKPIMVTVKVHRSIPLELSDKIAAKAQEFLTNELLPMIE
ncbi:MAG TPA: hypothetical protein VMW26_09815 [Methanomassiliicoccales archaeon]|jgi:hypothetical protein|nr:hypothetical protein [Methanomassiliicoccales archaeon]